MLNNLKNISVFLMRGNKAAKSVACTLQNLKKSRIKIVQVCQKSTLPEYNEQQYCSRYHPTPPGELAEQKIRDILNSGSLRSTKEWDDMKKNLMADFSVLNELNYSTIVMNGILTLNKIEEGHSFMRYLEEARIPSNLLTYLKYMALCGKNVEQCGQEMILDMFEKIKPSIDSTPVLDGKRAEHVIQALCATHKWALSLDYLKKVPYNGTCETFNSIGAAAIRNGNERLAWEVISKWIRDKEFLAEYFLREFLLYALNLQRRDPIKAGCFLLKFFQFLQERQIVLCDKNIKLVEQIFSSQQGQWKISYATVSREGTCKNCNGSLEVESVLQRDLDILKKAFFEKSLRKSDVFINTTEQELNSFLKFINFNKPFDIVLDGLNVAHSVCARKNDKVLSAHLLNILKHLSQKFRRILVLGKYHMKKWPAPIRKQISQHAHVFLTNNISQDDPFVLFAALESGPQCRFMTSDLMRDHSARLDDPQLIRLFKSWQQTHQMMVNVDERNNVSFVEPLNHSINIQGNMVDGWHIPFDNKIILDTYEELNNWLCIRRIDK